MNPDAPLPPAPAPSPADAPLDVPGEHQSVLSSAQLREHGVAGARLAARCRPGGPWQSLLPGVYLLRRGVPTGEERLRGALLYAGRPVAPRHPAPEPRGRAAAVLTGLAALALHGFATAPPLRELDRIDVLVPRIRRLRSTGFARIVRAAAVPDPEYVTGLPVAPVARAVADAVAATADPGAVRLLVTEAVGGGHCEPAALVAELDRARLLRCPPVARAVDELLAEGRSRAEERLYSLVYAYALPDPLWNVDLKLPGGTPLGRVDAYWTEQCTAVLLEVPADGGPGNEAPACAARRDHLERLGITVIPMTPRELRDDPDRQATVIRTALLAALDRDPPAYVVVLPH
ncbi:hypothetical protein [Streptomyces tsukubensis]|uniref:DUF559 domain-containing protein n=1 Tax=Streptomyces tsukubensis (strain DSM 42081 / NBRC 108919 / NRRL 18488 / 9993) TaxID=1114943 RepID=A0A7G3UK99_STRT9|nr:hypothetical protein [Streptomyces tsukubensis]AZK94081.1 hypothetical protein B7R87_09495 [Streptomyces tsukubensis]QKM69805.1 hypothetical protein STSU_024315 [Streptomyces tsukubensis NRRL18488]TAI46223.1 hypothetical protein EWI31_03845 [Streptomyces tsukubensis]